MCLIISKRADVKFSAEWLKDFYRRNRDGAGIMWQSKGVVEVEKITRPSEQEWIDFYREFAAGRECVIHLRMRTHGTISDENTHPYYVGHGIWLMHNGILKHGNVADTSRSDTYHFIKDFIRPALRRDPKFLNRKDHIERLGREIGANNKFVFCGVHRNPVIVNKHAGVMRKGAWFSNTYAWTKHTHRVPHQYSFELSPHASTDHQAKIWTLEEWQAREAQKYYMQ
jgi:predicted glutamine amidotransferase